MAVLVYKDAQVDVNGTDLTDHVQSAELSYSAELPDFTAMGSTTRTREPGLLDWSVTVTFFQDFAASNVDATLFPLIGSTQFAIILRPTSAARSATNPDFTGNVVLESYNPMAGTVGDAQTVTASFQAAGDLARTTTSS
jgi:hypothetical protein